MTSTILGISDDNHTQSTANLTMTSVADLISVLESTNSPKKLMMVHSKFVAPFYMANSVMKVSGTYHAPVS